MEKGIIVVTFLSVDSLSGHPVVSPVRERKKKVSIDLPTFADAKSRRRRGPL